MPAPVDNQPGDTLHQRTSKQLTVRWPAFEVYAVYTAHQFQLGQCRATQVQCIRSKGVKLLRARRGHAERTAGIGRRIDVCASLRARP